MRATLGLSVVFLFLALVLVAGGALAAFQTSTTTTGSALILYDSSGTYGWIGAVHARMLASVLGHFPLPYTIAPVEGYTAGQMGNYKLTFYIGTVYNNILPAAFRSDVMTTTKPLVWFDYNLWEVAWTTSGYWNPAFQSRFGFMFFSLDQSGYPQVLYNNATFTKDMSDPEEAIVGNLTSAVSVPAWSYRPATSTTPASYTPYIVHGGNLWYVADVPFSYISGTDRYVAFADLMHDIVGINHPVTHRALIRIEDVDPTTSPTELKAIADYLYSQSVPFLVSVVPVYQDPLGYYSNGVPESLRMSLAPAFISALKYMVARGGQLVDEGYTHQYDSTLNPYTGVSGDDFEFYRVTADPTQNWALTYQGPVAEDSQNWIQNRINSALGEYKKARLPAPVAWVTPHYAASGLDYRVVASNFPVTMQRVLYFDNVPLTGAKNHITTWGGSSYFDGLFFPYVIQKDLYGQKVVPENIGGIELNTWFGNPPHPLSDVLAAAQVNLAVRDGWAAGYFDPDVDILYLQQLVKSLKGMGYTFVPLTSSVQ